MAVLQFLTKSGIPNAFQVRSAKLGSNTFYSLVSHDLSNLDSIGDIIASVA
jgi:hypothetical protein